MHITLKIKRFNPEVDQAPHWELYPVSVEPTDRVLDALHWVKENCDGTLALRRSCAHGICGSDAMRINGRNALACKVLVKEVAKEGGRITVEPLLGLKVIKDLIVEMTVFFENYRAVLPYLVTTAPLPENGRERLQSPAARERFDDGTRCILCAACTTACPPFWSNPAYLGPAAIVQAHRFIFDDRDQAKAERLKVLNTAWGVWRCRTVFNCTEACPREIPVTRLIGELKKLLASGE
jgi:succinate dehydrogenase / fumarate reductase, iron-sulfur subunit